MNVVNVVNVVYEVYEENAKECLECRECRECSCRAFIVMHVEIMVIVVADLTALPKLLLLKNYRATLYHYLTN